MHDVGTDALSWRRLNIIIGGLQADETSMLYRAMNPDTTGWRNTEELLAHVADLIAVGNWQRQGKKSAKKPEPLKRPGRSRGNETAMGTTQMSFSEVDAWLAGDGMTVTPSSMSAF